MTDMQRYGFSTEGSLMPKPDGPFVLASDAEAAIAAAEQRGRDACKATHAVMGLSEITRIAQKGYDEGQRDMLARCIAAVEDVDGEAAVLVFRRHVLAALRALGDSDE